MRRMFSTLRTRVLLLIAIPFAVMVGMTVYQTLEDREEHLAGAQERVLSTARLMAAEQRRIIDHAHQILLSVALLPELRRGIAPDACSRVLSEKVKKGGVFVNMLVALPDGKAICNAMGTVQPINIADRDFFQRALQTHEFVVGGYIISRSTSKPAIGIAYPLLDQAGRPELVVSATLDLGWLEREMAKFALPEGSNAVVLDDRGIILARHPDVEGWAGKPVPAEMALAKTVLGNGGEGTADELGLDGVRRIFAFTPLHTATTGQVYLWVGIPKDAIVGPVERKFVWTVLIASALLVLTFGAFWLGSERLFLRRIAALGKAATRLSQGELASRTGLQPGDDEVALLVQSFDQMAGALETKAQQLMRANRALQVISSGNRTMLHATSEQQLIENLCRAMVEAGGYRIAWVGYAENDAEKTIRPVAQSGTFAEGFFEGLTWSEAEGGLTPPGKAIRSGIPVAIQDIQKETGAEPWRQNMLQCGCGSCVALPLRIDESVIGVLDVCAEETGAFGDEEVGLLAEAAGDLSYGIAALRGLAAQVPLKAALRTAEERLRAAAEASLDALFILKSVRDRDSDIVDFEFVDINASAERMLGMTRDKVIGQRLRELLSVDRIAGLFEKYAQVVTTGTPLEEEFAVDIPEIKAKWLRQQAVRVDDGIAVSSQDITVGKMAEAKLRESEGFLNNVVENIPNMIFVKDAEALRFVRFNKAGEQLLGYPREDLLGKNDYDLFPKEEADFFTAKDREVLARKILVDIPEEIIRIRDKSARILHTKKIPILDNEGKPQYLLGISEDITERKQAQAALQRSESSLKQAQRIAHLGNWELDLVSNVLNWSDEIYRIFEIDPEEFSASYEAFLDTVHPEDRAPVDKAYTDSVRNKTPYEILHKLLMKDGRVKYVHERCETSYDQYGRPLRSIGTVQDITARKQGEFALERATRALRTLSTCNEVLVRAGNESELLDSICRLIGETGGYRMAWVGFPEQDPAKTVRPVAYYGCDEGYLEAANISWADSELGRGPTGMAIQTGSIQINRNFLTDPVLAPWRDAALKHGYQSSIALPLKSSAGILGALTIYAPEPDAFNEDEVRLLQELAEDLAFGVTSQRARAALAESQERLQLEIDRMPMAHIVWDADFRAVTWNAAAEKIFGYTAAEAVGHHPYELIVPKEAQPQVDAIWGRLLAGDATAHSINENTTKDGRTILCEWTNTPLKRPDGTVLGVMATTQDITARRRAELALERANRALRTLSACNVALVRAGNEAELLNSICRLIVETGGYLMAWGGFPEHDPAKTVRPVAQYGREEGYLAAVKFSWADSELGRGPTGMAVRTGSVQVNRNFLTDPALTPWREAALKRGYRSSIALPLKSSEGTFGVLTIYAAEPDAFNEDELRLLQELAEDLTFGVETLRTRADRDRIAYEHLHHAEILRQSLEDSIKAIANTVEMRDPYTAGHQRRVGKLAVAIARELGLPEETNHGIELAASIHDLGKISVPAEILAKPSRLTDIEFMLIKNHAQAGYDILKDIKFPWPIATMVLQHHERLDGSGYPQGLKGEQILLESRIMAVADVVEAMASHRPYRAALGIEIALKEIERGRGSAYDPLVVDACIRLFAEQRFELSS